MIKVEAIKQFTLGRFNEIKNIKRRSVEKEGMLFVGDTFECSKEMAEYLTGKNEKGSIVVKVLEVIPEVEATIEFTNEPVEPKAEINIKKEFEENYIEETLQKETKKTTKKKKTSKK